MTFTYSNRLLLISLIALSSLLYSCGNTADEQRALESKVTESIVKFTEAQFINAGIKTGTVEKKAVSAVLKLNGRIEVPPQNMISISVPLGGYLKSTTMLPGTRVIKGQALATIEDAQYIQLQQDYLVTLAKMSYAEIELRRQKELNVDKAGSDKALQIADADFRSQRISAGALAEKLRLIGVDPAKVNEKTISRRIVVRSPISGFISKVNGNIGSYINPSDVLFELVNPDDIHLNLTVFEKDLDRLAIGQKAVAYSNNNPDNKHITEVILISRDLSADRSVEVHCHFDKYDKTLLPGMYMNAEVALKNSMEQTLPENSVVSYEGKQYVFLAKEKYIYEIKEIQTGNSENGFITIKTELDNKRIVTEGAYSILMQLKNVPGE